MLKVSLRGPGPGPDASEAPAWVVASLPTQRQKHPPPGARGGARGRGGRRARGVVAPLPRAGCLVPVPTLPMLPRRPLGWSLRSRPSGRSTHHRAERETPSTSGQCEPTAGRARSASQPPDQREARDPAPPPQSRCRTLVRAEPTRKPRRRSEPWAVCSRGLCVVVAALEAVGARVGSSTRAIRKSEEQAARPRGWWVLLPLGRERSDHPSGPPRKHREYRDRAARARQRRPPPPARGVLPASCAPARPRGSCGLGSRDSALSGLALRARVVSRLALVSRSALRVVSHLALRARVSRVSRSALVWSRVSRSALVSSRASRSALVRGSRVVGTVALGCAMLPISVRPGQRGRRWKSDCCQLLPRWGRVRTRCRQLLSGGARRGGRPRRLDRPGRGGR